MKKGLLASLLLGLILIGLWPTFSKKLKIPALNTSITIPNSLEKCDLKKQGNPLLAQEPKLVKADKGDALEGVFKGTIQNIKVAPANLSAQVQLASDNNKQVHTFNVKVEGGLSVYKKNPIQDLILNDLKNGQAVSLTFSCPANQPDQFRITKVVVE